MKQKTDKPTLPKEKPNHVVIEENFNKNIDKLFEIYANDKAKARAYYYINNIEKETYSTPRTVAFEYSNGDVRIARIIKRYGVSTTNKMFSGESNEWAIIYKKEQDKFYFNRNYKFKGYSLNDLSYTKSLRDYLSNKFPVLRTALEQRENCRYFNDVLINVISRKKIFSKKAMLRHIWDSPYKTAELLINVKDMQPKLWFEMRQSLYNIENIRPNLFNDKYFRDTRKFAASLGKKINCAWSEKRLKLQHDIWAKEVVDIILEFEELRDLKIKPIYQDFADFSGFQMFLTNHELIAEGKKMSHCVGTYSGSVDAGESGIYSYGSGTLELGTRKEWKDNEFKDKTILYIKQYQGYGNREVPLEDYEFVKNKIYEFNETRCLEMDYELVDDELPF